MKHTVLVFEIEKEWMDEAAYFGEFRRKKTTLVAWWLPKGMKLEVAKC